MSQHFPKVSILITRPGEIRSGEAADPVPQGPPCAPAPAESGRAPRGPLGLHGGRAELLDLTVGCSQALGSRLSGGDSRLCICFPLVAGPGVSPGRCPLTLDGWVPSPFPPGKGSRTPSPKVSSFCHWTLTITVADVYRMLSLCCVPCYRPYRRVSSSPW